MEIELKISLPYKFTLEDLEDFISKARQHNLNAVYWDAHKAMDQRDSTSLTLKAKEA